MTAPLDYFVALAIMVGIVGVIVPVLPGVLLVWGAVAVWATERQDRIGWTVFALARVELMIVPTAVGRGCSAEP